MSSNRYNLSKKVKDKWYPIIKDFLDTLDNWKPEYEDDDTKKTKLDLSDTELNPYTLRDLLIDEFGYEEDEDKFDTNGWEMDFWIYLNKPGHASLSITGTGITFELNLNYCEDDD